MKFTLAIAALSVIIIVSHAFRTQSVAVKGKLMCGSQPAANVQVKLLDEDHGDPDDTLDNMFTKADGLFSVSGSASELTPIDPELRIYHDCNDHGKLHILCHFFVDMVAGGDATHEDYEFQFTVWGAAIGDTLQRPYRFHATAAVLLLLLKETEGNERTNYIF
ncbi:hypothetical protein RB195_012078 [Necator americanus]|uniref:Transthyretin-like family protein n=1 Tax=Necator americanus TaxID=51031 RepID=A0ABR1D7D0_NECAM